MRAGKLDKSIQLTREVMTPRPDEPWVSDPVATPYATVRAEVVQQSTTEFMATFGEGQETAIVFRTRYRGEIMPTDKVVFAGRAYDLIEVTPIGDRRGQELRAKAVPE